MAIFWFILIGLIAGWMATTIAKGDATDLRMHAFFGVIGSLTGGFIFPRFGYTAHIGFIANTASAFGGAVIVIFILRYIRGWINYSKVRRLKISQKNEEIK